MSVRSAAPKVSKIKRYEAVDNSWKKKAAGTSLDDYNLDLMVLD